MKHFFDTVKIIFKAGKGGNGVTVFFQDWKQKRALPQGGDGGDGGNIILIAKSEITTLVFFHGKRKIVAESGCNGSKSNRNGKRGDNLLLWVPVGTLIFDSTEKELIFNFIKDGDRYVVAKGGMGGFGNKTLSRKNRKVIDYSLSGTLGQEKEVMLDLRLLSDVALIGLPNAGKTSLLKAITNSHAKVGSYPFTTLSPNLAWSYSKEYNKKILFSDLPGIIKDAHLNKGLGNQFLKHMQRSYLILHLIDLKQTKAEILANFYLVNNELFNFNKHFVDIPQIIVGTKLDAVSDKIDLSLKDFNYLNFKFLTFLPISSWEKTNLIELEQKIFAYFKKKLIKKTVMDKLLQDNNWSMPVYRYEATNSIHLRKISTNTWELSSYLIDSFIKNFDLTKTTDLKKLNDYLIQTQINKRLISEGVQENDLIYLNKQQFYWKN